MYTPIKPKSKLLNSSFSPFMSPAISKVSTACDLLREQRNSNSKKRFARKRQASNESLKRIKPPGIQCKGYNNQRLFGSQKVSESSETCEKVVPELILKKNPIMTSKYLKIPTDRSSNNDNFPCNYEYLQKGLLTSRERARTVQQCTIDHNMVDYKTQLQMKNSELMILEDENMRLRKDLQSRQSHLCSLQRQNQQLNSSIQTLTACKSARIHQLQSQLQQKDQQLAVNAQLMQRHQKMLTTMDANLKQSNNQVELLKHHLQQLMERQLSKQTLQLVSYREVSLSNQLVQLKNDFQKLKTQQHRNIEIELGKITEKLAVVNKDRQNLSIANRMLNKKNKQLELSIQKKYKNQLTEMKQKLRNLVKETAMLKKENVALRKTVHMQEKKNELISDSNSREVIIKRPNRLLNECKRPEQTLKQQLDSDDSFTMSLSK